MLYLYLSKLRCAFFQISKTLVNNKVIGVGFGAIESQFINSDGSLAVDILANQLNNILQSSDVSLKKSEEMIVAIPHDHFSISQIPLDENSKNIEKYLISYIQNTFVKDPSTYENYYKIITSSQLQKYILYIALHQEIISQYQRLVSALGAKLNFLTPSSYCYYALTNGLSQFKTGFTYIDVNEQFLEAYVYDQFSPIAYKLEEITDYEADIKKIISDLEKNYPTAIVNIIIGGPSSLELNTHNLVDEKQIKMVKISNVVSSVMSNSKLIIDQGTFHSHLLAPTLGLYNLVKSNNPPNFATDLKSNTFNIPVKYDDKNLGETSKSSRNNISQKNLNLNEISYKDVVEYSKPSLFSMFSSKKLIFILSAAFGIIIVLVLLVSRNSVALPFLTTPSPTPSITQTPTATATPTVDPSLKRTDIKVNVQNGTEKQGAAADMSSFLEDAGYNKVAKENAAGDMANSQIKIKPSKKNYLPFLIEDLIGKLTVSETIDLDEEDEYDAIIIIGLE